MSGPNGKARKRSLRLQLPVSKEVSKKIKANPFSLSSLLPLPGKDQVLSLSQKQISLRNSLAFWAVPMSSQIFVEHPALVTIGSSKDEGNTPA